MTDRPGPRTRLLDAAREVTYSHGVQVGVDKILERAQVARQSLYQHFAGKDDLVAQALATNQTLQRLAGAMEDAGDDPRSRVIAAFDDLQIMAAATGFHGCRYAAAELAVPEPEHPVHAVVRDYKAGLHRVFRRELQRLGHSDPDRGATQLVVLIDGALVLAATVRDGSPASAARALCEAVLDDNTPDAR